MYEREKPYKAIDIANFVIQWFIDEGKPINNTKIQKLLFFIQKECLKELDVPCFNEDFVAWASGPVVPCVFYETYLTSEVHYSLMNMNHENHSKIAFPFQKVICNVLKNIPKWGQRI